MALKRLRVLPAQCFVHRCTCVLMFKLAMSPSMPLHSNVIRSARAALHHSTGMLSHQLGAHASSSAGLRQCCEPKLCHFQPPGIFQGSLRWQSGNVRLSPSTATAPTPGHVNWCHCNTLSAFVALDVAICPHLKVPPQNSMARHHSSTTIRWGCNDQLLHWTAGRMSF